MPLTADDQQERLDARLQFCSMNKKKLRKTRILRDFTPEIVFETIKIKSDPYSDIGKFAKLQTRLDLFPKNNQVAQSNRSEPNALSGKFRRA